MAWFVSVFLKPPPGLWWRGPELMINVTWWTNYHILPCICAPVYNVHPHFCAHHTRDYYTRYYTHGMQSLYPCIMLILIFPPEIWAKKCTLYTAKYSNGLANVFLVAVLVTPILVGRRILKLRDVRKAVPSFKSYCHALTGVAQWAGRCPTSRKVVSSVPVEDTCLDCGPGPQLGACGRRPINVSLSCRCFCYSLSPSLPFFLKRNKIFFKNLRS